VDTKGESVWRRWFGKRREVESDPPARDPAARETLGRLLRVFVDLDIDLAEPEAKRRLGQLTRWAAEVVAALGPRDPDEPPVPEPDWVSLRKTFTRHRRAERHFVAETIGGFREALVNVAQSLTRTVESDGAGDARVARSIAGLKALARTPTIDLQRLRSSVMETVGVVEAAANERAERHQQEVGRLRDILRAMRVELKRANEKAETDPLTGLANRASLDGHLAGTAAIGAFRNSPTTLILMDLDHFKRVNDDHGHLAGDAVLRTVGERLRALGLRETDLIARYGGEEFAIVLHECREDDGLKVAERVRAAVDAIDLVYEGTRVHVTASLGVAERKLDEAPEAWIERADQALYSAKSNGRDQVSVAA